MDPKPLYMGRKRSIATIVRDVLREEDEMDDDDEVRRRLSQLDESLQEEEDDGDDAMNKMEEEVREGMQLLDNDVKEVHTEEIKVACKENFDDTGHGREISSTDSCMVPRKFQGVEETGNNTDDDAALGSISFLNTQKPPESSLEVSDAKVIMKSVWNLKLFAWSRKLFLESCQGNFYNNGQYVEHENIQLCHVPYIKKF